MHQCGKAGTALQYCNSDAGYLVLYSSGPVVLLFCDCELLRVSKTRRRTQGYFGECGLRGGYMEVHGIGAEVSAALILYV